MVELKITNAYSPILFGSNHSYQLVVMPMLTDEANNQAKRGKEAQAKQQKQDNAVKTDKVETKTKASKARPKPTTKTKPEEPVAIA